MPVLPRLAAGARGSESLFHKGGNSQMTRHTDDARETVHLGDEQVGTRRELRFWARQAEI